MSCRGRRRSGRGGLKWEMELRNLPDIPIGRIIPARKNSPEPSWPRKRLSADCDRLPDRPKRRRLDARRRRRPNYAMMNPRKILESLRGQARPGGDE